MTHSPGRPWFARTSRFRPPCSTRSTTTRVPGGRSRYVAEAVAQRVRRDALGAAIRETAGAMAARAGRMTPDQVARWVDELRTEETE